MPAEHRKGPFVVSTDPARLDVDAVHLFLTTSYWAEGVPREVVARSLENCLAFGLYDGDRQIGLARVVTDRATFAYLSDVYVLAEYRGKGLGTWLMECVMAHPDLQRLRRFALTTRDAHALYRRYGFAEPRHPERHMEILKTDLYRRD